jgi:hypothetical protein
MIIGLQHTASTKYQSQCSFRLIANGPPPPLGKNSTKRRPMVLERPPKYHYFATCVSAYGSLGGGGERRADCVFEPKG